MTADDIKANEEVTRIARVASGLVVKLVAKRYEGFAVFVNGVEVGRVSFRRERRKRGGVACYGGIRGTNGKAVGLGDDCDERYTYFADVKRDLPYLLVKHGIV